MIIAVKWDRDEPVNYALLRRRAEEIKKKLKLVAGTENVKLFGDPAEEVLVELDYDKVISLGLTPQQVAQQIEVKFGQDAAGLLRSDNTNLLLEMGTQQDTLDEIANAPIQTGQDAQVVQLADIASVKKHITDPPSSLAIVDGKPAIALGIFNRDTSRIDVWARDIESRLAEIRSQMPDGLQLITVYEQNDYVSGRLGQLINNLLLGGLAITAVIFLMMGWRNALIVVSALPLAACMVLTGMKMQDIPIHQMSVTGLIIALGLLIDNAIVMVDEVTYKMRIGKSASQAIRDCVGHLFIPLLGSTLTTCLAFGPIALMPGPAGEFVGSIAISVIMAIISSFILAMTIIPALTAIFSPFRSDRPARLLSTNNNDSDNGDEVPKTAWWLSGISSPPLKKIYNRSLEIVFARPWIGLLVGAALPIVGFIQARHLPEQFFPPADRDQIQIELELSASASIDETLQITSAIREELLKHERVNSVDWFLGESAPTFYYNVIPRRENSAQYAQAVIGLDHARELPALIHKLQSIVDKKFPSSRTIVRQLEQGPPFDAPVEVRLFGPDLGELRRLSAEVRKILVNTPGVVHTRCDLNEASPTIKLDVDEEETKLTGLDSRQIGGQLNAATEGVLGGSIIEVTEELQIRVRLAKQERSNLDQLMSLSILPPVVGPANQNPQDNFPGVPLAAIAQPKMVPETATISHLSGRRMSEIQAFIPAGVLPSEVLEPFKKRLAEANIQLPPGYKILFGGESAKRNEAIGNLMSSVSILMVLMVATLVLSFGSFRMATIVGVVAALSVGLGMGALWLYGFPFGFMAIVGTMGLIGVAINDTIVVLAAIREDEVARTGDREAIRHVVNRATRHILSTSLTTMVGFLPLILSGGGFWPPLAITIAGGVGGATIIALYFGPSAYILLMCNKWKKLLGQEVPEDSEEQSLQVNAPPQQVASA